MAARPTRRLTMILALIFSIAVVWMVLHHECASGGAMGEWYRECTCRGIEWVDFDKTAADGPLRTICFGWVTARTCYRYRSGPRISCGDIEP